MTKTFSSNGIALLKQLRGFKARPYKDSAGRIHVGYGHRLISGDGVAANDIIEEVQATGLLNKDVEKAASIVNGLVTSNLTQNQFDALVLFVYNAGIHTFQNSALLHYVNEEEFSKASSQFLSWCKVHTAQGAYIELAGLRQLREAEQKLFNTPDEETVHG